MSGRNTMWGVFNVYVVSCILNLLGPLRVVATIKVGTDKVVSFGEGVEVL